MNSRGARWLNVCVGVLLSIATGTAFSAATKPLAGYNIKPGEVTVSGISSGAFMAVQLAVSNSSVIKGVGAIAGGPYECAQGRATVALDTCMVGQPDMQHSIDAANLAAAQGAIDPVAHLSGQKVWLFHGYNDGVVKRPVSDALQAFYAAFTSPQDIFYKTNVSAGHSQVTLRQGQACELTGPDYVNRCDYDAAGKLLGHLLGTLKPPKAGRLSGSVLTIAQSDFHRGDITLVGMARDARVYVPARCKAGHPCRLHVALHGCKQSASAIGNRYYSRAGYNTWADANDLVVLYPQTLPSWLPQNPDGCWDWWGYNGDAYTARSGAQLQVIRKMIDRLSSRHVAPAAMPSAAASAVPPAPAPTVHDSTDTSVSLTWFSSSENARYNVYRATCASCALERANVSAVRGSSFADARLTPATTYFYAISLVDAQGVEGVVSPRVSGATASTPPGCDPYTRDNLTHWLEGRADVRFAMAFAKGSGQPMGLASASVDTTLVQDQPGHYVVGPCR